MAQQKTPEEQIKELQTQISVLQQQTSVLTNQTALVNAQVANQAAQQTSQAAMDKAIAEKLKDLVETEFNLDKARGKGPFAELLGIKEALNSLQLQGKEGAIGVSKGTDGALLLGVKKEMLLALDSIASDLINALPQASTSFVIVSKTDLEASYKSQILLKRIEAQQKNLEDALAAAQPAEGLEGLSAALAGVQTAGLVLGALSDFGKFFRTDRTFSVFDAGEEAQQLLELLLERKANAANKNAVIRIDELGDDVIDQAMSLISKLNALKKVYDHATDFTAKIQKASDEATKLPPDEPKPQLPSAQSIAALKGEMENSKTLLDGLSPSKSGDAFWSQVAGLVKQRRIGNNDRLAVTVKAQTVQVLEKRTWRSDRLLGSGEVQVHYRLTNTKGEHVASGILLRTSSTKSAFSVNAAEQLQLHDSGQAH